MTVEMRKPHPLITPINEPFWSGCNIGELRVQLCNNCGHHWLPAGSVCPNCLSSDHNWVACSGRGRVFSWIRMHKAYIPAFGAQVPYVVALIELDEGPLLMSSVITDASDGLQCDLPVNVTFPEPSAGDPRLPLFKIDARASPRESR